MLRRIVLSVIVGVVVTLACTLLGTLLSGIDVSIAFIIGHFLSQYAGVIGILSAVWYFFAGGVLSA